MKTSKLLSTTVLVSAAALIAAAPASAAKLKLGGYYEQWFGWGADGKNTPQSNFDVKNDAEIYFSFKEKLSNGMTVGGRFEMEAGNGNSGQGACTVSQATINAGSDVSCKGSNDFDETSVYISGSFGKLQLGNNDVAAASAGGVSVVGPVGIIKSDAGDWIPANGSLADSDNDLGMGDAQNIHYSTPKINGLQLSVSYTPDKSDGVNSAFDDSETSGIKDGVSGLIKYSGKFGGAGVTLALGRSEVENGTYTRQGTNISLKLSTGPYTITATNSEEKLAANDKQKFFGAGLIYKLDKANSLSVGYGKGQKVNTSGSDTEQTVYTVGASRNLGKGVSISASVFNSETQNQSASSTNVDDTGFAAGVRVNF